MNNVLIHYGVKGQRWYSHDPNKPQQAVNRYALGLRTQGVNNIVQGPYSLAPPDPRTLYTSRRTPSTTKRVSTPRGPYSSAPPDPRTLYTSRSVSPTTGRVFTTQRGTYSSAPPDPRTLFKAASVSSPSSSYASTTNSSSRSSYKLSDSSSSKKSKQGANKKAKGGAQTSKRITKLGTGKNNNNSKSYSNNDPSSLFVSGQASAQRSLFDTNGNNNVSKGITPKPINKSKTKEPEIVEGITPKPFKSEDNVEIVKGISPKPYGIDEITDVEVVRGSKVVNKKVNRYNNSWDSITLSSAGQTAQSKSVNNITNRANYFDVVLNKMQSNNSEARAAKVRSNYRTYLENKQREQDEQAAKVRSRYRALLNNQKR